jgi:hypothetical protein
MTENSDMYPRSSSIANAKGCDAKTLAIIAAQFIVRGEDEEEAIRKANALYLKASAYAKEFASLPRKEREIEASPEEALRELGKREDLAIGDSEANSAALDYFRKTAKTKLDQNITHKKFVNLIEQESRQKPERIAPEAILSLHSYLRARRSRGRAKRREKNPVKKNRTKRGV